jgi:predicted transcriptional regulator
MATSDPVELAVKIVGAFVSHNSLPISELPTLIQSVHEALAKSGGSSEFTEALTTASLPAVPIRKSITPDYLICLEDGKRFKSMRRHLTGHGMTAEQYRAKWGLPSTYPTVAPNYASQRSALAKSSGLGQWRKKPAAAEPKTDKKTKGKAVAALPRDTADRKPRRPRKAIA